jgi:hypothetical protein
VICLAALAAAAGCADRPVPAPPPQANAALLDQYVLTEKPVALRSFSEVRDQAADGEEVVFQGQIAPATCKPFAANQAAVLVMDPKDLDDPAIKKELECDNAAT